MKKRRTNKAGAHICFVAPILLLPLLGLIESATASHAPRTELFEPVSGAQSARTNRSRSVSKPDSGLNFLSSKGEREGVIELGRIALLLDAIVIWISSNFDLPADFNHPEIRIVSQRALAQMRYGESGIDAGRNLIAIYSDDHSTVYISESWSSRSATDLSVLVHEVVHHLQHVGDRIYSCAGEREKLAHEAQEKWLHQFGRSLQQDFGLDRLTLMVAEACMF